MEKEIEALTETILKRSSPFLISAGISHFVIDSLRKAKISLYEAYLINMDAIKFSRLSYVQPAWNKRVQISTCITLLNQKLLANVFEDNIYAAKVKTMALEAYEMNKEKRKHYIVDRYLEFLEADANAQLLQKLLRVRRNYDKLSDDNGPYHNEVFPYNYYCPEEILLNVEEKKKYLNSKDIGADIEELIIQLSIYEP